MIVNPIIPTSVMFLISVALIVLIFYNTDIFKKLTKKETKNLKISKYEIANVSIKVLIVLLLFVINLRFMYPNGETTILTNNLKVLFVIDNSVSMKAMDYNGTNERMTGVIDDCCHIIDELSGASYSIITFGDTTKKLVPFTSDSDMAQATLKTITPVSSSYAKGTSLNLVKELLEETLKEEYKKTDDSSEIIVFFISDGEITVENEHLESFASMKKYISGGAVLGYGTNEGGKMLDDLWKDSVDINGDPYYVYYYEDYNKITAISKIDEQNLNKLASDLGIDYLHMDRQSRIDNKLKALKTSSLNTNNAEEKINNYSDIYYVFAVPLLVLLIIDFIIQKRKM